MAELTIGDEVFNVVIEGPETAPAVLMAHSLGADLTMWDPQAEALAKRFRVIRYDSRGHGASVVSPAPYGVDQLGGDALAILDALGVEKAHFIGLSLGGLVGMWLLVNAPNRVDRVVLSNTSACFGLPDVWNSRIRQARTEGLAGLVAPTMDRWFTPAFHEAQPETVANMSAIFAATSPEGYAGCVSALRDADFREALRSAPNRTLVIVGSADPSTPPAAGGLIASQLPDSKIVALDAAHISNLEAANAFTRAVTSFLTAPARVEQPAPARKAAKKAAKKVAKQVASQVAKSGAKKAGKKASKGSKQTAKKAGKKAAKKVAKSAKKPSKKFAKKSAKKVVKSAAKKSVAKKTMAKKTMAKKTSAKKTSAKKTSAKKTVARKTIAKKAKKTARR